MLLFELVAMNMPLNDDGTVEFKPTLFALGYHQAIQVS